jgi:sigma-B regulation protein RsbU (phosphoserine phosphatase)
MTTAAVVAYYSQESEARVSYAGHPPVLYRRASDKAWSYARPPGRKGKTDGRPSNIPLAIDLDTLYGQLTIPMAAGDRLFVYTDGIIDAPSPEGESFGLKRLCGRPSFRTQIGSPQNIASIYGKRANPR